MDLPSQKDVLLFIPLRHESMRGRPWPYVTFALIALNVVIFLLTHGLMEGEQPQILLAGMHPELQMPPEVSNYVESIKKKGWL